MICDLCKQNVDQIFYDGKTSRCSNCTPCVKCGQPAVASVKHGNRPCQAMCRKCADAAIAATARRW